MKLLGNTRCFFFYQLLLLSLGVISLNCLALPPRPDIQKRDFSQNAVNELYSFKQLGWDSPIMLSGYKPSYTFYLPITKRLNVQKAVLHLKMAFSPFLSQESRVDIRFNQKLIRRLTLPQDLKQEVNWDIELPLTDLSSNWQALTFSAHLFSAKNLCDPDIWIYISSETTLALTSLKLPFDGLLNQLPYPFINPTAIKPVNTLLLLPRAFAVQEIFSLFQVALRLGELAGDSKINLSAGFVDDFAQKQKESNLILIGIFDHLFKETGIQINNLGHASNVKKALANHAGILLLSQSPFNPLFGLLTITGRDEWALEKAITAFLTPEFKVLASGQIAVIDQIQLNASMKSVGEVYHSTLKELGYSDQSVSGFGRHQLTYSIPLPNDRVPNYARIKTFITAPLFASQNNSLITLMVNGKKQSSFWPSQEHFAWQTEIATDAMKPGVNRIDYLIDLHAEHEQCTYKDYNEVWATIYAETTFESSFFNRFPLTMLNQLPVPFNAKVTFVLPEQLSKEDINNLANLFFKFGQLFQPSTVHFYFQTASKISGDFIRHNNVILIGTPDNNPWIKFTMDYMPLQLNKNARILKLPQKILEVSDDYAAGLLELMPSPWSEGPAILLITGSTKLALSEAIHALIDDTKREAMNGNIALINADQSIEVFNHYESRYISLMHRFRTALSNRGKSTLSYLESHPQTFIYLLVVIVPLIILRRRKNKGK